MRIGDLARTCGVSTDTLRLWQARGLIRAERRDNGYRDFGPEAPALVGLIRLAQGLGFTLAEIGAVLEGLNGDLSAAEVEALLAERIARLDRQIAEMQHLRMLLEERRRAACALGLDRRPAPLRRRRA